MGRGLIFKRIFLFFLFCTYAVHAKQPSQSVQNMVAPYLLPCDHPVKPMLDAIFGQSRATLNLDTLEAAGFIKSKPRRFTNIVVTKHPAIPGFIFKIYLDAQRYHKNKPEYHQWMMRIQGVQLVDEIIKTYGLGEQFKCPKKWMYALPKHPKPPSGYPARHYILIEEDMDLVESQANEDLWASEGISKVILDQLFFILEKGGLADSAKPPNIPFSSDGRIAFIDTEIFGKEKIRYKKLLPFLSKSNQEYWKTLIKNRS